MRIVFPRAKRSLRQLPLRQFLRSSIVEVRQPENGRKRRCGALIFGACAGTRRSLRLLGLIRHDHETFSCKPRSLNFAQCFVSSSLALRESPCIMHSANCRNLMLPTNSFDEAKVQPGARNDARHTSVTGYQRGTRRAKNIPADTGRARPVGTFRLHDHSQART